MPTKKTRNDPAAAAESLAIQALAFLAEDEGRLGRFLAVTGVNPSEIRNAAREPQFLAGVLEYLIGDESVLLEFVAYADLNPSEVARASRAFGLGAWERDTP